MLTYRLGAASYAGGQAMAHYLGEETLSVSQAEEKARYYAAEASPRTRAEALGAEVHRGEIGFSEALDTLIRDELEALPSGEASIDGIEEQLTLALSDGVTRADIGEDIVDQTIGVLKPGLSDAMAERLGIDRSRPLTNGGVASLMAGLTASGSEIQGKHRQSPMKAVGEVFGLSATALPNAAELGHVLAGRRINGTAPQTADGKPLPESVIRGGQHRFRAAVGLSFDRDPTPDELGNVAAGRMASGAFVDMNDYRRAITATRAPVGFADLTFSASKSLSSAWALASDSERVALLDVHARAVDDAMRFMEDQLGWARKGHAGRVGVERAELAWVSYQHFTSRPVAEIARSDAAGNEYTEFHTVETLRADPNLHTHVVLLNHALVQGTGRLASVDFDRLKGLIHQGGEVYRAYAAKHAKDLGIKIAIGEHGDAQLTDVDLKLQRLFSKRSEQAEQAAREFAGPDWDSLKPEQKIERIRLAAAQTRENKSKDAISDFEHWRKEAADAGFEQKSVLRQRQAKPELAPERRQEIAREVLQPFVEKAFQQASVIDGDAIRALAARSMIVGGIGDRAADEISAITRLLRHSGVRQDGQRTDLVWDKVSVRGKDRTVVSTDKHLATENDVIALTQALAADRSKALSAEAIDRAAAKYLQRHPGIDPDGVWKQQIEWAHQLGEGGCLSIGFGAAGVGKSTVMTVLTDAWKAGGRQAFGAVLSHTQVDGLAGIDDANKTAMDPFLRRAAKGKYALDRNSVIVIDEVGLLGNKQMREVLKLADKTGATVVMIGDPAQCRSPEAGDPLELIERALPDAVPELVKSIRQRTTHEQAVTHAFRTDPAAGLRMKIEDGSASLVAGGSAATIERAVRLRRERLQANTFNPNYTIAIMAPTNATASTVSKAIRADRQQHGEIGPDRIELDTQDAAGRHKLKLAIGDDVRAYSRVWDGRRVIASNGEAIRIQALDRLGMEVKNLKTGVEGRIAWSQLSKEKGEPARLIYAGCSTIDSAQGSTVSEALLVLADGTDGARANKVYTALSRHQEGSYLLVSDAAVRRQIAKGSIIGEVFDVKQPDVWRQVGTNISRVQMRENATASLRQVNRYSGIPRVETGQEIHSRTVRRVVEAAQSIQRRAIDLAREVRDHGPARER